MGTTGHVECVHRSDSTDSIHSQFEPAPHRSWFDPNRPGATSKGGGKLDQNANEFLGYSAPKKGGTASQTGQGATSGGGQVQANTRGGTTQGGGNDLGRYMSRHSCLADNAREARGRPDGHLFGSDRSQWPRWVGRARVKEAACA